MSYYDGIDIVAALLELANKHQLKLNRTGNEIDFYFCPGCNDHQIDFNLEKAVFKCHRCSTSGTFRDLYDALEGKNAFFNRYKKTESYTKIDLEKLNRALSENLFRNNKKAVIVRNYLNQRHIDNDTAFYHKLGYADEKFWIPELKEKHYHLKNCITFPVFDKDKKIINIRFKQTKGITPDEYNQSRVFNLKGYGNLETNYIYIPEIESPDKRTSERIWIFEGEPDAILAWQLLKIYADPDFYYSTRIITGTAGANSLPKEWTADYFRLPTTVFYDNDRQGKIGAEKINEISKNIRVADFREKTKQFFKIRKIAFVFFF